MLSRRMKDLSVFFFFFCSFTSLLFVIVFLYTNTMSFLPVLSLLHNLFIHFALNLSFLCPLSFCLLWFCFLLPLLQGQHQGLGLSCSSTREWDDTAIYSSSGRSACPGSSHGPCHQTLSTSFGSFCVSGAPCFSFHEVCEFPMWCFVGFFFYVTQHINWAPQQGVLLSWTLWNLINILRRVKANG